MLLKEIYKGQEDEKEDMWLLDGHKERRRYWKSKEESLYRTLWRTRLGRGY